VDDGEQQDMTVRDAGLRRARAKARELVKRWGIKAADDIRVEAIAKAEGLRVIEGPLRGARGRLSAGPKPVIRIADSTIDEGARRFTIAHELAHHLLKHPVTCPEGACASARAAGPAEPNQRDYEAEANAFASELLLPANLVAPRCDGAPSLEIPRAIAFEFTTSIPASSITYVHLTRQRCAAIYSTCGAVEWASKGRRFKTRFDKGKPVLRGSMAYDCARNVDIDDRARSVPANLWIDTKEDVEIIEHSAPVSQVGGVITLLWVPEKIAARLWPSPA